MKTAKLEIKQDVDLLYSVWAELSDESGHSVICAGRMALLDNAEMARNVTSTVLSQMGFTIELV